jgi:hypothetical protein
MLRLRLMLRLTRARFDRSFSTLRGYDFKHEGDYREVHRDLDGGVFILADSAVIERECGGLASV